jgi:hypothetical protein
MLPMPLRSLRKNHKGRDIMKTGKNYLWIAIVIGILCVPAFGEVEPPLPGTLLGQPNPTIARIRQLYVVILTPVAEPNKDGLVWKNLETEVESKISQGGIKIAEAVQREHLLRSLAIPELRIDISMLKLDAQQQYVFHIQTSLAKRVYLTGDTSQSVKVDVWQTEPVMQAVSVEGMPAAVTSAALEQVEAFILACLAANPPNKRPADVNDVNEVSKEQAEPAAESKPAENKYVASKNSEVFHKPECLSAKRIKPENLIGYSSREEAIKAGKRPCGRCNP